LPECEWPKKDSVGNAAHTRMTKSWGIAGLIVLALALRVAMFNFVSTNMADWVMPWFEYIDAKGITALGENLPNVDGAHQLEGNYTPPYYYLLYVASLFDRWAPRLYLIKTISVLFDFVVALFMYRLARAAAPPGRSPWIGFFAVLLAPTVLVNGSLWGQCDVITNSLVLGAVYFTLSGRAAWAIGCFAVAMSFKATAVFLSPFLLMLTLRSKLPWTYFFGVPAIYAAMMTPAAILGRPIGELASVYMAQASFFQSLSMEAPNFYAFISNDYYTVGTALGITCTVLVSLAFAVLARRQPVNLKPRFLLLSATLSVAIVPFLLPKMHDRYFFAADILSIALAVCDRRLWFVPVLFQCSSLVAYLPVLSLSWGRTEAITALRPVAVFINCGVIAFLALRYWHAVRPSPAESA